MISEAHEFEGAAIDLYRRASLDPAREAGALRLASALDIDVRTAPMRAHARVAVNDNAIELRRGQPLAAMGFWCGHELGHWTLRRFACGDDRVEHVCSSIGSCIVVPRPALYLMRAVMGYDVPRIARTLATTERLIAMRWGVAFEEPVAIIERTRVLRSGPSMNASDADLRRIVRAGGAEGARLVRLGSSTMVISEV